MLKELKMLPPKTIFANFCKALDFLKYIMYNKYKYN